MNRAILLLCAAAAAGLGVTVAASAARADECDDAVAAINKRMDAIRATRKDGDKLPALCARLGRISGLTAAVGIVAKECLDEGKKRDDLIKDAAETEKALEVDNLCN
jgi:hypothetical protein